MSGNVGGSTGSTVILSLGNSTTTVIASAATFTGAWETNPLPDIGLSWKFDTAVTVYLDFSNDGGVTTVSTYPVNGYATAANIGGFHIARKLGRSARVRVVNSANTMASADLGTYYGAFEQPVAPLSQTQSLASDATLTRQIPSDLDIDLGGFSDISSGTKFGNVEGVGTASNALDIWAAANTGLTGRLDMKTFPTSASTFYIASTSASDTDIDITANALDATGLETTVSVNLNGTTVVSLGSLLDVNSAYVSGANQTPIGDIWIGTSNAFTAGRPTTASETVAFIPIGFGRTQQTHISVPSNKKCRISRIYGSLARASGAAGSAEINFRVKESGGSWMILRHYDVTTSLTLDREQKGLILGAGARCVLSLSAETSDNGTDANGQIEYDFINV